ncbi:MAG: methylated-DNA--[protein]-cysteine S-methyltransferase [Candidatus Heimdallarchaeota archaeon]
MIEKYIDYYESPIGIIEIISTEDEILTCNFVEQKKSTISKPTILLDSMKQLNEYFYGKRMEFDLKLKLNGTIFQNMVWKTLQKVPYGKTITYKELAQLINRETAIRAVGSANGQNPISIIIPCHRIIGSDGKLRGYGGGIEKKKWLLEFEAQNVK